MAKKEKKQKPLEQVLMEACNKLRSNMSGINYMYFVMGLVFLKFAFLNNNLVLLLGKNELHFFSVLFAQNYP